MLCVPLPTLVWAREIRSTQYLFECLLLKEALSNELYEAAVLLPHPPTSTQHSIIPLCSLIFLHSTMYHQLCYGVFIFVCFFFLPSQMS